MSRIIEFFLKCEKLTPCFLLDSLPNVLSHSTCLKERKNGKLCWHRLGDNESSHFYQDNLPCTRWLQTPGLNMKFEFSHNVTGRCVLTQPRRRKELVTFKVSKGCGGSSSAPELGILMYDFIVWDIEVTAF